MDKFYGEDLPSYDAAVKQWSRKRRSRRLVRFLLVASTLFCAYHFYRSISYVRKPLQTLSIARLQEQHASCASLQRVPNDHVGPRFSNKRWINGTKPVVIRNATVWTGEPIPGTSKEEAKNGTGYQWTTLDVLLDRGLIVKIASNIPNSDLPPDCVVKDTKGRQLTAGIVDMHSHAGMSGFASLGDDTNELSGDITPYVKSLDGFNPLAPELQWIKSGGVTTSLILPGSGNNMGGEAFVLKLATGKPSGRAEISQEDMFADPDKTWRYMKMACGENPKRVYGKIGHGPFSRLGEAWEFRHAFEQAKTYVAAQEDWCRTADSIGASNMKDYLPFDLKWESLGAVLRGQVRVNTHCYTIPDLEAYVRLTNEFKFRVYAFHHAHQTYLIPEVLRRAYGGTPAAALFADNMYYKMEAYTASEQAGKILWDNDIVPVYVSDNPVLNSQHVVFEASRAYGYGLPYHVALAGVTSAPAELLGFGDRLGKIKEGFDADIVLWDSDPLQVGSTPVQVWIDGAQQFEKPVELEKPIKAPIVPDMSLANETEEKDVTNIIITGILTDFLSSQPIHVAQPASVVILNGSISCIGDCEPDIKAANAKAAQHIELRNGYLTSPLVAFGSSLGLLEIDAEGSTHDGGYNSESFARAVDGLALGGKQLRTAYAHGVTKAISAPSRGGINAKGISVGFLTDASTPLGKSAIWQDEVAVHYPLTSAAKNPSISNAIGVLRGKLLKAAKPKKKDEKEDVVLFSEDYYLRQVVSGKLPLVLSVHKADTIAAIIRMKDEIQKSSVEIQTSSKPRKIKIVILGGAESHLVAKELAAADIAVVLAPLLPYAQSWDERRSLTGAPLTNGTAIDILVDAGVLIGIGVNEIWETRNLGLMAGWAYVNGEGRLTEKQSLDLVGSNIYKMLGIAESKDMSDWLVWEGNPLQIGSRLKGVGSSGKATVWI